MKRNYLDDTPTVGVLKAVSTVVLTHGAFAPAAALAVVLFNSWLVVPFLFAPGWLMLFFLAVACVLRIWGINGFYRAVLGKIQHLYRPSYTGWRRGVTRNVAYPALGAALLLGIGQEPGLPAAVVLMFALLANFFTVGGILFSRKRHDNEAKFAYQLAQAMVDFFTSSSDPKYKESYEKPKHGLIHNVITNKTQMVTVTYVNEDARLADTLQSITKVKEVQPGVFKVNIRNRTAKDDAALLKTLQAVAGQLGAYDWENKDEDERAGFLTLTFWMTSREDATTVVTPYLLWNAQGAEPLRPNPDRIPVGVRRDGSVIAVGIREQSGLIVGNPGAGKSGAQRVVMAGVCQLPNVAIIGLDPKRVELGLFADRMTLSLKDKRLFPDLLDALYDEMDRRNQILEVRGISKITPDMWEEFPQIFLMIDELPQVFVDWDNPGKRGEKSYNYIRVQELVALGRNTGITVVSAAQRPKSDVIPTNYRDLQAWRMGFRMTALSAGLVFESPLPDTHLLRPRIDNGRGYLLGEESDPSSPDFFRAFWLMSNHERANALASPDISADARNVAENAPTIEEIVEATKHLRVSLPFLDKNKKLQQGLAQIAQDRELARRADEAAQRQSSLDEAKDPDAANNGSYQP